MIKCDGLGIVQGVRAQGGRDDTVRVSFQQRAWLVYASKAQKHEEVVEHTNAEGRVGWYEMCAACSRCTAF